MKILLIPSSYLPNIGGLETVTAFLAKGLHERGHSVSVITQRYPRTLRGDEEIAAIRVQRWHFLLPRLRDLRRGRVDLFIAGLFYFPVTLLRLIAQIKAGKPNVVNLHFVGAPSLFVLMARWVVNFRLVVSLHGDDVEGLERRTRFDRWLFRAVLRRADAVTACSRYLLDRAKIEQNITFKAHVIYNGFDLQSNGIAHESVDILAIGRMVRRKGFDLLLYALAELRGVTARLIGDGPERAGLEKLARELGVRDRVEFCGAQSRDEVMSAMAGSRVVVIPSRQESFGLVALEAMAAGKPVVAARVGGLPELLDSADAFLIEPESVTMLTQTLGQALHALAHNPGFGGRNREAAQRFSTNYMVAGYENEYSSL